jgi:hypothetical protein
VEQGRRHGRPPCDRGAVVGARSGTAGSRVSTGVAGEHGRHHGRPPREERGVDAGSVRGHDVGDERSADAGSGRSSRHAQRWERREKGRTSTDSGIRSAGAADAYAGAGRLVGRRSCREGEGRYW